MFQNKFLINLKYISTQLRLTEYLICSFSYFSIFFLHFLQFEDSHITSEMSSESHAIEDITCTSNINTGTTHACIGIQATPHVRGIDNDKVCILNI